MRDSRQHDEDGPALLAEGLSKAFGTRLALEDVSFQVEPGRICGVVGPDGAGKTTLLRTLLGLMVPDSGRTRIMGLDPFREENQVRRLTGYVSQAYSLYGDLSVDENLEFYRHMYGLDRKTYATRREELLELTGLAAFSSRRAAALSGGMYKKLALACALLHRPKILFLDEPTNGVDVTSRRQLWELLSNLATEGGTVVTTTPLMEEADRCHQVVLLSGGRLLLAGKPWELERKLLGHCWKLETTGALDLAARLEAVPWVRSISLISDRALRLVTSDPNPADLSNLAAEIHVTVQPVEPTFEDVYLFEVRDRQENSAAPRRRDHG